MVLSKRILGHNYNFTQFIPENTLILILFIRSLINLLKTFESIIADTFYIYNLYKTKFESKTVRAFVEKYN